MSYYVAMVILYKMIASTCCRICYVFCCPPCPAKITTKIAFSPPKPSYIFLGDGPHYNIELLEPAKWMVKESQMNLLTGFFVTTRRRKKVACMYINCVSTPRYIILHSHGNAIDMGMMCSVLLMLGIKNHCNIVTYDYCGFGLSSGKPSEKNIYADIAATWDALNNKYKLDPSNVILYGQSIGTAPTVDLAAKVKVAGVVLHSVLMSCMRVPFPKMQRTCCCDAFPIIDKCQNIESIVLVIHGVNDTLIHVSHGEAVYQVCPNTVTPLWVPGAMHNDLELYASYWERLRLFIFNELPSLQ